MKNMKEQLTRIEENLKSFDEQMQSDYDLMQKLLDQILINVENNNKRNVK